MCIIGVQRDERGGGGGGVPVSDTEDAEDTGGGVPVRLGCSLGLGTDCVTLTRSVTDLF